MTPLDYGLYSASILIWGLSWICLHFQVGVVAPEVSIVWRYLIATPMMFALAIARGESLRYRLSDHAFFAGLGLTVFSMNYLLFYYAAMHVPSGLLSIQFTLAAIFNAALGAIFFRTRIQGRVVVGGLFGMAGVAAMFFPEVQGLRLDGGAVLGFMLGLLATLLFCGGNMISLAAQRRKLPMFATLAWAMTYGTALVAVVAFFKGATFTIDLRAPYLISLAYISLLGSFAGFAIYFTLLGRIGPARAGYSTVLYPVVALAASTVLEGYRWTPLAVAGLVSVMIGVFLVLRPRPA
ncbi:DMT family transporter [Undibacter mobilis]|uniref:DMT family transporter n=1 Tax=Undibacter mobilis TaxID=2292256 RepID=A0A371B7S5_9BRAD|nr:DMT family transporter [Undibacter mobilis]RDV03665.1 DMT family transporter [Undibacter mobilis]